MPTGNQAAVGGKVAAALTNQYGDFPSAVAIANDAALRSITSSSYAALSTPVSASLVLTRTTLVAITFGCIFGDSAPGTPTNWASLSVALTGAYVEAASDFNCVRGFRPAIGSGGTATIYRVVPAGTLTASLQAFYGVSSGFTIRNSTLQLAAVRLA